MCVSSLIYEGNKELLLVHILHQSHWRVLNIRPAVMIHSAYLCTEVTLELQLKCWQTTVLVLPFCSCTGNLPATVSLKCGRCAACNDSFTHPAWEPLWNIQLLETAFKCGARFPPDCLFQPHLNPTVNLPLTCSEMAPYAPRWRCEGFFFPLVMYRIIF